MGAVYLAREIRNLGDRAAGVKEMIDRTLTTRSMKRPSVISNANHCC